MRIQTSLNKNKNNGVQQWSFKPIVKQISRHKSMCNSTLSWVSYITLSLFMVFMVVYLVRTGPPDLVPGRRKNPTWTHAHGALKIKKDIG